MHRRRLSFVLLLWMLVTLGGCATLVADPLPSWNERATKHALYDEAKSSGWFVISMKNDWKRIFAFEP